MGLYINGIEYDILSPTGLLTMEINPKDIVTNGLKIFSSDDYILKDADGSYITAVEYIPITSVNNDILLDINDNYLIIRKEW